MSAVQAALGVAQMERIEELIAYKRTIFRWYQDRLAEIDGVSLNVEPPNTRNSYWMVTIILDPDFGIDKYAFVSAMAERNVDTRPFFSPLSSLPAFESRPSSKRFCGADCVGPRVARYGINLPSGYNMTEALVDAVCAAVRDVLGM